jgi:hypothetical protein
MGIADRAADVLVLQSIRPCTVRLAHTAGLQGG